MSKHFLMNNKFCPDLSARGKRERKVKVGQSSSTRSADDGLQAREKSLDTNRDGAKEGRKEGRITEGTEQPNVKARP